MGLECGAAGERVGVLERQLQTSRHEASVDPLTHIANRRTFDQMIRREMNPRRPGFVLALLDIDAFKTINDTRGTLKATGHWSHWRKRSRRRYRRRRPCRQARRRRIRAPGDRPSLRQAEFRLKTVTSALAAHIFRDRRFVVHPDRQLGVSEFSAGDTAASLIHRADEALYQAKHLGKNRVVAKPSPLLADLMKRRDRHDNRPDHPRTSRQPAHAKACQGPGIVDESLRVGADYPVSCGGPR